MMSDIILKCECVTKVYKQGEGSVYALRDVGLSVKKGSFVLIVGRSGSGKSTLLNILSGFDKPTSGKVYIDNIELNSASEKDMVKLRQEKIGFVFQSFNLLPILTAAENIVSPMLIARREWSADYFNMLTEKLGLTKRLNHLPAEMSGGECQRTAVARALIGKPSVLFADEPTGNLDKASSNELVEILKTANRELGQTIVMVTHDDTLIPLADIVYRISDGEISEISVNEK